MMKKFFLILFVFFPTVSFAIKITNLYQAELPVVAQTAEARADAAKEGFKNVLIKLTGNIDITQDPKFKKAIERADYFVQDYSYLSPSPSSSQYQIIIHYEKEDVLRLLKKHSIPLWGETRPLIIVWIASTTDEKKSEILGSETSDEMLANLTQAGKNYGLPFIFPMIDVTDLNQVSSDDVNHLSLDVLKEASKRYSPEAFLIGSIEKDEEMFQSKWQLILEDQTWNWSISDKTKNGIIESIINEITKTLAKFYINRAEERTTTWLELEIDHVNRVTDLAELMQYLKQLAPVQQTRLTKSSSNSIELSVLVKGSLDKFQKNAEMGKRLMFKSQDESSHKLFYEWTQEQ